MALFLEAFAFFQGSFDHVEGCAFCVRPPPRVAIFGAEGAGAEGVDSQSRFAWAGLPKRREIIDHSSTHRYGG